MKIAFALALIGLFSFALPQSSDAQQFSCTYARKNCIDRGVAAASCQKSWNYCMKKGQWIGSETGNNYGPHRKE